MPVQFVHSTTDELSMVKIPAMGSSSRCGCSMMQPGRRLL
ncbi:hypothetical protein HDF12_003263 [Edaphobacter lichenicola]|uniref:Uncharacterized protein n=2 Tax=Tunturiibacter TaxID=3154218 RepID=A0A7Y9NNX7_9BACT|nr:hypothetical protein [Edaphobacter lichenicola]NYF52864.1 hypothetical protein [Edaphobacter lichenicola]